MTTATGLLPLRYRSVRLIGRGGMADVYSARDRALEREVAVKVLADRYANDAAIRARFTREALAAARLSGKPYTVTIYDVGESNRSPFIVMEWAAGGTVADRLQRGNVSLSVALEWLDQAAAALDAAHASGVVHRDVKPANLLLSGDDSVRVADFGIASASGLSALTETGTVLGTAGYLAPEQASGRQAGPEADQYSLAIVAYELLAGRRPYQLDGSGAAELVSAARRPVPRITKTRPALPASVDTVFERALAQDPSRRYRSCAEFVATLRDALAGDAAATHVTQPMRAVRGRSQWRLAGPVLLALAAGGAAAALLATTDSQQTRRGDPVRTETAGGTTTKVAAAAPRTTTAASASGGGAPAGRSAAALNLSGYRKMQAGDYRGALPLLQQSVEKLAGTGSTDEAYALYNLAFTRFALGSCNGVADMLDRSEQIQGHRSEIDQLRRRASRGCR
jgi:tRNA A-37 threonylcarbamoyl transferase component Bud32